MSTISRPSRPSWRAPRAAREPDEQIENYRKAIELVRAPYLADVDMPWALGERERLEQIQLSALQDLAHLQFSNRRLQDALATAQRILLIDPYREEVHRSLMKIHAALMDRPAIHRQYQTCRAALENARSFAFPGNRAAVPRTHKLGSTGRKLARFCTLFCTQGAITMCLVITIQKEIAYHEKHPVPLQC